jgi:hypothetical protein
MSETNPDRMIRLYFGQPGDQRPTKKEVANFITDEMGLVRGDENEPQWSKGVGELVQRGMEAEKNLLDAVNHDERERLQELEEEVDRYREQVQRLKAQLDRQREEEGHLDAARRVHRIEASILEILCQNEAVGQHAGPEGMNYVELYDVARLTGYDFDTVLQYARTLSRPEYGGHVQLDSYDEEAKATSRDAFEAYCDATDIEPGLIRRQNGEL